MLAPNQRCREAAPAGVEDTLFLPGLSPVAGNRLGVRFDDGGDVSPDGGLLVPQEIDRKIGIADDLARLGSEARPALPDSFTDLP